jgi:hypothetical protein
MLRGFDGAVDRRTRILLVIAHLKRINQIPVHSPQRVILLRIGSVLRDALLQLCFQRLQLRFIPRTPDALHIRRKRVIGCR